MAGPPPPLGSPAPPARHAAGHPSLSTAYSGGHPGPSMAVNANGWATQFDPYMYQSILASTAPATFARTASAYASAPALGTLRSPDIIDNVLIDHSNALTLFSHFFQAAQADSVQTMGLVVGALALELRLHSQAEIQVLYPVLTQRLGPGEGAVLAQRALAEHAMVEASIEEMLRLRGSGDKDALIARVKQAQTELMTHNAEEEAGILPRVAAVCTPEELTALGLAFRAMKQTAPLMPQQQAFRAAVGAVGGGGGGVAAPIALSPLGEVLVPASPQMMPTPQQRAARQAQAAQASPEGPVAEAPRRSEA